MNEFNHLVEVWVYTSGETVDPALAPKSANLALWLVQADPRDVKALLAEKTLPSQRAIITKGPVTNKAIDFLATKHKNIGRLVNKVNRLGLYAMLSIDLKSFQIWLDYSRSIQLSRDAVDKLLGQ